MKHQGFHITEPEDENRKSLGPIFWTAVIFFLVCIAIAVALSRIYPVPVRESKEPATTSSLFWSSDHSKPDQISSVGMSADRPLGSALSLAGIKFSSGLKYFCPLTFREIGIILKTHEIPLRRDLIV